MRRQSGFNPIRTPASVCFTVMLLDALAFMGIGTVSGWFVLPLSQLSAGFWYLLALIPLLFVAGVSLMRGRRARASKRAGIAFILLGLGLVGVFVLDAMAGGVTGGSVTMGVTAAMVAYTGVWQMAHGQ